MRLDEIVFIYLLNGGLRAPTLLLSILEWTV